MKSASNSVASRVTFCSFQNEVQNDSPYLVRYGQLESVIGNLSAKRPPMVSYDSNLVTVHKMLYFIIVKVKLAI